MIRENILVEKEKNKIKRKPVAYGDLRGWIDALNAAGELAEFDSEVDWDTELGTIIRLAPRWARPLAYKYLR